jgi:hypothetical protein
MFIAAWRDSAEASFSSKWWVCWVAGRSTKDAEGLQRDESPKLSIVLGGDENTSGGRLRWVVMRVTRDYRDANWEAILISAPWVATWRPLILLSILPVL